MSVKEGHQSFLSLHCHIETHASHNLETKDDGGGDSDGRAAATLGPLLKVVAQSNVTSVTFLKHYTCDTIGFAFPSPTGEKTLPENMWLKERVMFNQALKTGYEYSFHWPMCKEGPGLKSPPLIQK